MVSETLSIPLNGYRQDMMQGLKAMSGICGGHGGRSAYAS